MPEEANDDDNKKAERAKRFGVAEGGDAAGAAIVQGLDAALPERRERKRGRAEGGGDGEQQRGPKRQSTDGRRGGGRQRGGRDTDRRDGGRDGGRRQGGRDGGRQQNGGGRKGGNVMDDPAEKAKAEARAKRFGGN